MAGDHPRHPQRLPPPITTSQLAGPGGAQEFSFLTSSPVVLLLLLGPPALRSAVPVQAGVSLIPTSEQPLPLGTGIGHSNLAHYF